MIFNGRTTRVRSRASTTKKAKSPPRRVGLFSLVVYVFAASWTHDNNFLFTITCSLSTIHEPMDAESVRKFWLSLPHVTEDVQWESDLLFRIGNKMFAVLALDAASDHRMSFKCTPEVFAELTEREGIVPAPYVARYHWVALERFDALPKRELKGLLKNAYQLILEKLPGKLKAQLEQPATVKKGSRKKH